MTEPGYIVKLDDSVIHKIAAGEIITEPTNVVKELLENSIDACADRIAITIENGGYGLIQIRDDGTGIRKSDMPLACARHTTSKLKKYNDLRTIGTFGFRGEALFSMSCCAHVTITTKTYQESLGYQAEYQDGKMVSELKGIAFTEGTNIEVRDLFYNNRLRLNARPKATSDTKKILEVVSQYSVTYPNISFILESNGKELLRTYGSSKTEDVLKLLFDIEDTKSIFTLSFSPYPNVTATMFLSSPSFSSKKKMNAIFINGRLVLCQTIKRQIDTAYTESIGSGINPFYFLIIVMPVECVEVNVHPSKKTVKFIGEIEIGEEIHKKIKESLELRRGSRPVLPMKEKTHTPKSTQKGTPSPQIDKFIAKMNESQKQEQTQELSQRDKARQLLGLPLIDLPSQQQSQKPEKTAEIKIDDEEKIIKPPSYNPETNAPSFLSDSDDEPPKQAEIDIPNKNKDESPIKIKLTSSNNNTTSDEPEPVQNQVVLPEPIDLREPIPLQNFSLPKPEIPSRNDSDDDVPAPENFELPKIPKSMKKQSLNIEKPKKTSISDKRTSLFSELKYKPKVLSAAEIGMQTLEQLFTPPTVISKPFRNVELQTILQMRQNFSENQSSTLTNILQKHTFLGFAGLQNFLISFGDGLYICNTFGVLKDFFVRKILEKFQNFAQFRLDKPVDIAAAVGLIGKDGDECTQILENNAAMLMDYFSISIEKGKVYSMPILVSNYTPSYSAMPLFLYNIATKIDWEDEMQCLSTIINELASVSCPIPEDSDEEDNCKRLMNQISSAILPEMKSETYEASMDAVESVMKLHTAASLFDLFH